MRTVIKVLRGVITALLFVVVGLNVWMAVQQAVLHRDLPEIFGYSQLVVTSGSMEPTFSAGDVIVIKEKDRYEPGEIVTFRDVAGALVTHRIVGTSEGQFITRGDANNTEDKELLPPGNIVGALVFDLPVIGNLLLFLKTPLGLVLLIVGGILLIELPALVGAVQKKGKGRHSDGGA